jgi:hypothetical protein
MKTKTLNKHAMGNAVKRAASNEQEDAQQTKQTKSSKKTSNQRMQKKTPARHSPSVVLNGR